MMANPPGFGERLGRQMKTRGFWKDGHLDVRRFCDEKGYRPQYVYAWLRGRVPTYDNLKRLARNFEVPVAWLMLGTQAERALVSHERSVVAVGEARGPVAQKARRGGVILDEEPGLSEHRHGDGIRHPGPAPVLDFGRLRQATEQVLELQAEIDTFLQAFPDLVMWLDVDGTVLDAKGGAGPGLAIGAHALGQPITHAIPEPAGAALARGLGQALRDNSLACVECELTIAGQPRVYEARLLPLKRRVAPVQKVLLIARDITDRKRAEQTLRVSEMQYRTLVEGSGNGMCIHREFVIEFANRAMARMFAYQDERELVGSDVRTLLPEHAGWRPQDVEAARACGFAVPRKERVEGHRKTGTTFVVNALVTSIHWRGKPATLLTVSPPRRAAD